MEATRTPIHDHLSCSRYNGYTREAYFSVGLQGIAEKDIQTVRDIIDRTIDDVITYVRPSAAIRLPSQFLNAL